jgi:hypothetical protein
MTKIAADLKESFEAYYEQGLELARIYVDQGVEAGNDAMAPFAALTEALNYDLDGFAAKANEAMAASTMPSRARSKPCAGDSVRRARRPRRRHRGRSGRDRDRVHDRLARDAAARASPAPWR